MLGLAKDVTGKRGKSKNLNLNILDYINDQE